MKVLTAYKEHDLSVLTSITEPIAVYTNNKTIYNKVVKARKDYTTHLIYDKPSKSPHQVIVDYQDLFYKNGASDLEVYLLPIRCKYVPYVLLLIVLVLLILLIVSFLLYKNKN